jgi:signal transduction histidine kinase
MKIRTKLSIQFTLIASTILLLFSISIYYFSAEHRTKEFLSRLQNRAISTVRIMEVTGKNSKLLEIIDKNTVNLLYDENILIYDYKKNIQIYKNCKDTTAREVNTEFLNNVKKYGQYSYTEGTREILGIIYPDKNPEYIVVASALDLTGIKTLNNLKTVLVIGFISCVILVIVSALFYSTEALKPISKIIRQVERITASKLNSRVSIGRSKDEIFELAKTFNDMLDRLENAFEAQRNFVAHASHEMRTPLTSMKGQIEVALMNTRSIDEYISVLNSINDDVENLTTLTNGFLEMIEASVESNQLKMQPVRIDEILFAAKKEISKRNTKYNINISFTDSIDDESKLTITANPYLLKILFHNLIDNGCKFSEDNTVEVSLQIDGNCLSILFIDRGIGIPAKDINRITDSFYRASNVNKVQGHGIGLSIASKIISLHQGTMSISSEINKGTQIKVLLPLSCKNII